MKKFGVQFEASLTAQLCQVQQHPLANSRDGQHLLRFADNVFYRMRQVFDGLGCVAVRTDAEGILAVDLEHVGGFVKNAGNRLIVHELKSKLRAGGRASFGAHEGNLPLVAALAPTFEPAVS